MQEVIEKKDVITPRKLKARKIVNGIIEGKSYTEIAETIAPNAEYPRQTLYSAVRTDYAQAELREKLGIDLAEWNEETITARIAKLADSAKNDGNKLKALELLAKIKAMLIEKREVKTSQAFTKSEDFAKLPLNEMISVIEARLKLNSQGVNTSQEKDNVPK